MGARRRLRSHRERPREDRGGDAAARGRDGALGRPLAPRPRRGRRRLPVRAPRARRRPRLESAPGAPRLPEGQSLSGLLLPDRAEIWVNREEAARWPGRRRFTIGHEVGHWVLHRQTGAGVYCRAGSVAEAERPALPPGAEEANAFAAALLMPAELVRGQYARARGDFGALCHIFGASGAAMGRRLHRVVPRAG